MDNEGNVLKMIVMKKPQQHLVCYMFPSGKFELTLCSLLSETDQILFILGKHER